MNIKNNSKGFGHIGLLLVVVLVAVAIGFVGIKVFKSEKDNKSSNSGGGFASNSKDCVGNEKVAMTHLPMNLADVATISPMGLVAGAHVTPIDHLYFYPKEGPRDKYPVYAMADGYITDISTRGVNVSTGESRPTEYRIVMQHTCRTSSYFDLITKLDDSITSKASEAAQKGYRGRMAIKSGQIIGWIGEQSLDTAIYDSKLTLYGFINPDMYKAEDWKIHTDDFYSYFTSAQQEEMQAKNARKVKPYSGKIDYDQPGKLIGNWFKEGTNGYAGPKDVTGVGDGSGRGYWSGHLAIFYDAYTPTKIVVSVGDFGNGQPMAFNVKGNAPDPAKVDSSSGVVKYELYEAGQGVSPTGVIQPEQTNPQVKGTILLQVQSGEKLKVQIFAGKTADQVAGFTNAMSYER